MEKGNLDQLCDQAEAALEKAEQELYRPSRDVVNYSVCVSARSALYLYLKYLANLYKQQFDGLEINESTTLEELIAYCRQYNDQLKEVDFSEINCKKCNVLSEDKVYFCNDVNTVKHCTDLTKTVKKVVLEA